MYISKKNREIIKQRFRGRCAYTGTLLKDDWQADHIIPIKLNGSNDLSNLYPAQKIVNHYKRGLCIEKFRTWYLDGLHERLKKLPKNPRTEKSIKYKKYLLEVSELFGITESKPFSGVFYFETLNELKK